MPQHAKSTDQKRADTAAQNIHYHERQRQQREREAEARVAQWARNCEGNDADVDDDDTIKALTTQLLQTALGAKVEPEEPAAAEAPRREGGEGGGRKDGPSAEAAAARVVARAMANHALAPSPCVSPPAAMANIFEHAPSTCNDNNEDDQVPVTSPSRFIDDIETQIKTSSHWFDQVCSSNTNKTSVSVFTVLKCKTADSENDAVQSVGLTMSNTSDVTVKFITHHICFETEMHIKK